MPDIDIAKMRRLHKAALGRAIPVEFTFEVRNALPTLLDEIERLRAIRDAAVAFHDAVHAAAIQKWKGGTWLAEHKASADLGEALAAERKEADDEA